MNDTVKILLQYVLKIAGAYLVTKGFLTTPDAATAMSQGSVIVGAIVSLTGLGWHFLHWNSTPSTPAPTAAPKLGTALGVALAAMLGAAVWSGCSTALKVNGVAVTTVETGMTAWAAYTQSGKGTDAQIITVSNAYNAYFNSEIVLSNAFAVSVTDTNSSILGLATAAAGASETNLLNLIQQFTK